MSESRVPEKVLIVLHGAIGDVTRALPLAMRMRAAWPSTHIAWGLEPISASLVAEHPAVDEVIVFDRPRGFAAFRSYVRELRSRSFDLVLDLQRHLKSGITTWCTGAPRRIGFNKKNTKECNWLFSNEHIEPVVHFSPKINYYQRFGDYLELPKMDRLLFGLEPRSQEQDAVAALFARAHAECGQAPGHDGPYLALILGSTWPSRFWPVERYVELTTELHRTHGLVPVLIGSRSEEAVAAELLSSISGTLPYVNLVSQTSLRELPAVFARCVLALGSDSGPMHIAAATGLPIVSLWGSTSAARSAPYGSEQFVMQSPIACSPCFRKTCPGLGTLCMSDISAEAVAQQVQSLIRVRGIEVTKGQ